MNIPETLTRLLSSNDSLSSLSSMLGIGREETSKAVGAAVPSLLGAFTQVASTSKGAQMLANAAAEQDFTGFENVSQAVSNKGGMIANQGSGFLSSILGPQSSALSGVLSRFCGVGEGAMGKMLGFLSPMILGFLGRHSAGGASGIMSLLGSQKGFIQSAMPAGLSGMLSSALPGFGDLFGGEKQAVDGATSFAKHEAYEPATRTEYEMRTRESSGSPARWALPVLGALAVIAVVGMLMRGRGGREESLRTEPAPIAVGSPARSTTGAATSSSSFVTEATQVVTEATKVVSDLRAGGSGDAAVEKIKELNGKFDSLRSTWDGLPEGAKSAARSSLTPLVGRLETASQSVTSLPVVGENVRPHLDQLVRNLRTFTGNGTVRPISTPPTP